MITKNEVVATGLLYAMLLFGHSTLHADATSPGAADDAVTTEKLAFKLTPSYYVTSHENDATDLNLRANLGSHAMWLGHYQRGGEFDQTRTGYEYTAQLALIQLVPSIQLATHGFAGASINAQIGEPNFALLGFGRTNMRDYYNLNFDPNDSVAYGFGTRLVPNSTLSLFTVKDNRLHTGQMVTHAVWRFTPDDHQRWTIDVSNKHGRPAIDAELVSGTALAMTYDYGNVFLRLARDQKVNFSAENQSRLSVGARF